MSLIREQWTRPAGDWARRRRHAFTLFVVASSLVVSVTNAFAQVSAGYLYTLSSFAGRLRYDWVRVHADEERNEIYVIYQDLIRIYNPSGMEIFSFGDDLDLGHVLDALVDRNGDIILLSYKNSRTIITRCNFRGVPVETIEVKNLPPGLEFEANRMISRNGLVYFVSLRAARVIITDTNWEFRQTIDFLSLLEGGEKTESEMNGFAVDQEGNIFFTMPTMFRVFKFSMDGKLSSFGKPGSAAGRFGVIAGIATDSHGNLLVVDKLKCVVMAFDKDFNFLIEFGYRGARPQNLIVPDDIAIDSRDRLYITQGRKRGVSVFALTYPQP